MLGERLTSARKRKKLTQDEVSSKLGIPRSTYSNYELGNREPDLNTLMSIAELFEVSFDWLVEMDVDNKTKTEESQLDKDQKYALELFEKITDPNKKKAAIEVLKGLAGEK